MRSLGIAAIAATLTAASVGEASVDLVRRNDLATTSLVISRKTPDSSATFESSGVIGNSETFDGLTPLTNTTMRTDTGTLNDTDTDMTLVLRGDQSASVTSTLGYSAGTLATYALSGSYASSITTGTLAGFHPEVADPSIVTIEGSTGYNSGISVIVTGAPVAFAMTVGQTNSVGTAFNAGEIYLDVNDDKSDDGDPSIVPYFVISGNDSATRTGTLQPSASPYRIFFFGNTFDRTQDDDAAVFDSSANFTSTFSLSAVPEPASLATLALVATIGGRRRR